MYNKEFEELNSCKDYCSIDELENTEENAMLLKTLVSGKIIKEEIKCLDR